MKLNLNTSYGKISCVYNKNYDDTSLIRIQFLDNTTISFYPSDLRKILDLINICLSADRFNIVYREDLNISLQTEETREGDYMNKVRYLYINNYKIHGDSFLRDMDCLFSIIDGNYNYEDLTLDCDLIS